MGAKGKKLSIFILIVASIFALDRLTKLLVPDNRCFLFICARRAENTGAAFSLFSGAQFIIPVLIAVALAVLFLAALFYFREDKSKTMRAGLALLFSGTLGNLIDRMLFGHVVDFITFGFWPQFPAFNVSDMANVAGAILVIIALAKKK